MHTKFEWEGKTYFDFLKYVRENYVREWSGNRRQDPYKFGFSYGGMTPIEDNTWSAIRYHSLEMYPQFPVGKYYLDFANPFYKWAIEVDGKDHDSPERKQKDNQRTNELMELGWKIHRIPGYITYRNQYCTCGEDYCESCRGFKREPIENIDSIILKMGRLFDRLEEIENPRDPNKDSEIVWLGSQKILAQVEEMERRMPERLSLNEKLFGYKLPSHKADYGPLE